MAFFSLEVALAMAAPAVMASDFSAAAAATIRSRSASQPTDAVGGDRDHAR